MEITPFHLETELETLNEWMRVRSLYAVTKETLPKIGFMAYVSDVPIACLFLRSCEGNFCMGDLIITNPGAPAQDRHEALNELFEVGIKVARDLGYIAVLAYSADDSTLVRLEKHGFKPSPFKYFTMNLREL